MQRRGGGTRLGAVLFTDIVGSTAIAAEMGNTRWSELVARHHRIVRRELARLGGHEMDTAGDGFFATFERPADAIRCAVAITDAVRELGIEVRAAVSFGELESVGKKASGLVVNTAARVMSVAGPGEVLVPASVREITTGGGISFADHGVHQLKGLDGEFHLFKVAEVDGSAPSPPLERDEAAERRRDIFPAGSSRRRALVVGVVAGILALVVVAALVISAPEPEDQAPSEGGARDTVAPFDVERGRIGTQVPITGGGRTDRILQFVDQPIAAGEGAVWVLRQPRLVQIDPLHDEVRSTLSNVGFGNSSTVATGLDAAWVQSAATVFKIHPGTGEGEPFLELPLPSGLMTWSFAVGEAIWVAESDGTLVRADAFTGALDQSETGLDIDLLATTRNGLWASDVLQGALVEIDVDSLMPTGEPLRIGGSIDLLVGQGDLLWVLDRQLGAVTRVNVSTRVVSPSARVGDEPSGLAVGTDAAWVGDLGGYLYRVDAETLQVERFEIGSEVLGVAVEPQDDAMVWLYLGARVDG